MLLFLFSFAIYSGYLKKMTPLLFLTFVFYFPFFLLQAYLVLLCFTVLHFTNVVFFKNRRQDPQPVKRLRLALLWSSPYCSGLELNVQHLGGRPALASLWRECLFSLFFSMELHYVLLIQFFFFLIFSFIKFCSDPYYANLIFTLSWIWPSFSGFLKQKVRALRPYNFFFFYNQHLVLQISLDSCFRCIRFW